MTKSSAKIKKMVAVALICALGYMCTFIFHFKVGFLTFDAKDAVITLASFIYGPMTGVIASLLVSFIEFFTISDTGVYGFIMNFASSAMFAGTAGLVYKYRHTMLGAVAGLTAAVFTMTALMLVMNLAITPYYMNCTMGEVMALIPTLLFPFNLVKAIMNAGLSYVLYRPLRSALQAAGLLPPSSKAEGKVSALASVIAIVIALLVVAAAALCFIFVLGGKFTWIEP
ncbi:MAG: ECF transporter S component [Clostridia bacterium]|nr:ECF transporter S component [Clostridia bacterium]